MASARLTLYLNLLITAGISTSKSWLKRGKAETSYASRAAPSGSNSFAASRRAVLYDLLRPLPEIPSILMIGFSPFRVA